MELEPLDQYLHGIVMAADRIAEAVRTEDPQIIDREIRNALNTPVPAGGPDPVAALITVLAAQVDTEIPVRERIAWTMDIGLELAAASLSTSSMAQPDGLRSVA